MQQALILCVLCIAFVFGQPILITPNTFQTVTVPLANPSVTLAFSIPVSVPKVNVYLFPCYGSYNWQLGYNYVPSAANASCSQPWDESLTFAYCQYNGPSNGSTLYVSVQGLSTKANDLNAAAVFNVYAYTGAYDIMGTVVPTPGNNGEVVATPIPKVRKRDKQQLTVSWTGTGNANDTYSVWTEVGSTGSGPQYQTGCGVRNTGFLTKVNVDITQSGNSYSTVLADIDQSKPLIFNVLVERQGGYYAAYTETTFNGSSLMSVSPVALVVALLLAFFANC